MGEAGLCEASEPHLHPSSLGHRLQLPRNGGHRAEWEGGRQSSVRSRDSGFKESPLRPHRAQGSKLMGRPASGPSLLPLPQFLSHLLLAHRSYSLQVPVASSLPLRLLSGLGLGAGQQLSRREPEFVE